MWCPRVYTLARCSWRNTCHSSSLELGRTPRGLHAGSVATRPLPFKITDSGPRISSTVLRQENRVGELVLSDCMPCCKATVTRTLWSVIPAPGKPRVQDQPGLLSKTLSQTTAKAVQCRRVEWTASPERPTLRRPSDR